MLFKLSKKVMSLFLSLCLIIVVSPVSIAAEGIAGYAERDESSAVSEAIQAFEETITGDDTISEVIPAIDDSFAENNILTGTTQVTEATENERNLSSEILPVLDGTGSDNDLLTMITPGFELLSDITGDFTDPNFLAAVRTALGKGVSEPVLDTDNFAGVTSLNVSNRNISSLAGLERFTALRVLNCTNNLLTALPVLPGSLASLDCSQNMLTSLPALPAGMIALGCDSNRLTALPSLPVDLDVLFCSDNRLTSLPALPTGLTQLYCFDNQLTALPALPGNLENLYCYDNKLTGLPALPGKLEVLYCSNNMLNSLPTLPNSLKILVCYDNQLSALPTLPTGLEELECSYNQLTTINVSGLTKLKYLHCYQNRLTTVVLNGSAPYEFIDVSYNYLPNESAVTGKSITWDKTSFIFHPQHTGSDFRAVTNIINLPNTATVGVPLTLSGTVIPADATNKTITWSLTSGGGTGASITNGVFTATSAGEAIVRAIVVRGHSAEEDYWQYVPITVTLNDSAPPSVTSVSPANGAKGIALSGNIVVTFSKTIGTAGTVAINGATLSGGVLSGNIYTVPYSGLANNTTCNITISGFKDAAGNTMASNSVNSFTTIVSTSGVTPGNSGGSGGGGGGGSSSASLSISKADFDKSDGKDITVKLTSGSYSLRDLKNDGNTLVKNTDYTVDGRTITISSGYLAGLAGGEQVITFEMSGGVSPKLTVTVKEEAEDAPVLDSVIPDTVTPLESAPAGNPFIDVQQGAWYYDSVLNVYRQRLMNGTADDLFSPDTVLTRGMIVTVLYRLNGSPDVSGLSNPFDDVRTGEYYTAAVTWAAANNIVVGYGNGNFGPDNYIVREQLATIIYRYQRFTGSIPSGDAQAIDFADGNQISEYAKAAVASLTKQGVITGKPGNMFDPKGNTTRAEFASVLSRM